MTEPTLQPTPKKIIRNTLYNTAGSWFLLAINFFLIPYIVSNLGVETYGAVWIVAAIVLAYTGLFDFGLTSSCTKYIAEYAAQNRSSDINRVISTGVAFYVVFALALGIAATMFGKEFLTLIGVPSGLLADAYFVLLVAIAIVVVTNLAAPITSTVTALQRMDITNKIIIMTGILNVILTVGVLYAGWGARGLILSNLFVQILATGFLLVWSWRLLPQLALSAKSINAITFRQLWRYAVNLQISRVSQIVVFQTDKIMTLRFFGATSAAYYELAVKVASLTRSIPLVLTSALLPVASEFDARNEHEKIEHLFERGSKYLIVGSALLLGFIFLQSDMIIKTWMGNSLGIDGVSTSSLLVKTLIVGYFFNITTGIASTIAAGVGKTALERSTGLLVLLLDPLLLIVLLKGFGLNGVALATMLTLTLGAIFYMKLFTSAFQINLLRYGRLLWKPAIGLTVAILAMLILRSATVPLETSSRLYGMILLAIHFIVFSVCYLGSLVLLKTFDEYDTMLVKTLLGKVSFWSVGPS